MTDLTFFSYPYPNTQHPGSVLIPALGWRPLFWGIQWKIIF